MSNVSHYLPPWLNVCGLSNINHYLPAWLCVSGLSNFNHYLPAWLCVSGLSNVNHYLRLPNLNGFIIESTGSNCQQNDLKLNRPNIPSIPFDYCQVLKLLPGVEA